MDFNTEKWKESVEKLKENKNGYFSSASQNINYQYTDKLDCLEKEDIEHLLSRIELALLDGQGSYVKIQNALEVIEDIKNEYL